jgi:hypothetical protein
MDLHAYLTFRHVFSYNFDIKVFGFQLFSLLYGEDDIAVPASCIEVPYSILKKNVICHKI